MSGYVKDGIRYSHHEGMTYDNDDIDPWEVPYLSIQDGSLEVVATLNSIKENPTYEWERLGFNLKDMVNDFIANRSGDEDGYNANADEIDALLAGLEESVLLVKEFKKT